MKTAFLGQAYQSRSAMLASQTAINVYPEMVETSGSDIGGFYGTPGKQAVFTGLGEVRGLWGTTSYMLAVIGNTVWKINPDYSSTNMGTLPNNTGRVSITDNGTQFVIAHQSGQHYGTLAGSSITPVPGGAVSSVECFLDGYGLFIVSGGVFGWSAINDFSTIDPLNIATAEGSPDDLVNITPNHKELWLMGVETTEVWVDTGNSLAPFQQMPGGFLEFGCAAKWSIGKADSSLFWVGNDKNGKGIVLRSQGYQPVRISTHAIEQAINTYSRIDDAIGYTYQEEGHTFYVLTFPTGDATWVYDLATKGWHQRAYLDKSTGILHRDRGSTFCNFAGVNHLGDWNNGVIYASGIEYYTDNGDPVYRERAWEIPDNEHVRVRLDEVELISLTGDGDGSGGEQIVWLQVSRDAGRTWGYERQKTLGLVGKRKARARWRRLGSGRDTVLKVATTTASRVSWIGANIEGSELSV